MRLIESVIESQKVGVAVEDVEEKLWIYALPF
jgi:hypothetical protein